MSGSGSGTAGARQGARGRGRAGASRLDVLDAGPPAATRSAFAASRLQVLQHAPKLPLLQLLWSSTQVRLQGPQHLLSRFELPNLDHVSCTRSLQAEMRVCMRGAAGPRGDHDQARGARVVLHTTCAACMRAVCGNDGVGAGGLAVASPGTGGSNSSHPDTHVDDVQIFLEVHVFLPAFFLPGKHDFFGFGGGGGGHGGLWHRV